MAAATLSADAAAPAPGPAPDAQTTPHADRDFHEWHGGIAHYGFWAVAVDCPAWHALFCAACAHAAPFVHAGYRRAPHVTIAAAGLLDERHASPAHLRRQSERLRQARPPVFELHAGGLDSFASAPYVAVDDPSGTLHALRRLLAAIAAEDSPAQYQPHLTVGLYRAAFDFGHVRRHLATFRHPDVPPLPVRELQFCTYQTHDIQGPFTVRTRVPLG